MQNKIGIIDYKMGNMGSVINMIKLAGGIPYIISNEKEILDANKIILPGVGSFDAGMKNLIEKGFDKLIKEAVFQNNCKLLGICLGMQLLLDNSEEGTMNGLGLIPGNVVKFRPQSHDKVPHMTWNTVNIINPHILFTNLQNNRFYFVHSYFASCKNSQNVIGRTNYINEFDSVIFNNNVFGAQFHPEKSHKFGLQFFKNYINLSNDIT
ncbi:MAG: imidazole glycerol phosphate synthase subunit HisH [Chitinophagaceae bacterium]|nr:imidazole glycerol phosphate synthase subunit HisH [Chitinophagaceae bacterium]